MTRPDSPGTISLDGAWTIAHDPLSQGLTERWYKTPRKDGWKNTTVPSAWQSTLGVDASGVAWYRRSIPAEALGWAEAGSRVRVRFESVATDAWLFVNGVDTGRHVGDFLPFELDITDALKSGDGSMMLYVRVDQVHAPRPAKGVVVENGHITKGFHDVLSLQHAGIWSGVSLRKTGEVTLIPNGISITPDPENRRVEIETELTAPPARLTLAFEIYDPHGELAAKGSLKPVANSTTARAVVTLPDPIERWSTDLPLLYTLTLSLKNGESEELHEQTFGFRTIRVGGPGNTQILLNGAPLQIRGVLHWGHEPEHIAPAPPLEQVRREFEHFRAMGFNCVCMCMVYLPEHVYQLADETGMLLWQEHPVWKSRMSPDFIPEYKRLYTEFFRRDRRHPSVIIVSGTCEHEAFNADLARWWWDTARTMAPSALKQIQTGFLEWTPPGQTDLYDDHVYDNCGRWVRFHEDMHARISELPAKPFIMGETIISNGWPDIARFKEKLGEAKPWWRTRGLEECDAFEREILAAHGQNALDRFRRHADTFARSFRKFQAEILRGHAANAGFVTNSIRDVPICRLGLKDDLDHWRFSPEDTRSWLTDAPLLLAPPDYLLAAIGGSEFRTRVGLSNFTPNRFEGLVRVRVGNGPVQGVSLAADPGAVAWAELPISLPPAAASPSIVRVTAEAQGLVLNGWDLVSLPPSEEPAGVLVVTGREFTPVEQEPEFEERAYSSGWGLPCRTWKPLLPDPRALFTKAQPVPIDGPFPPASCIVTHRLTRAIDALLKSGGRAVLLASRHAGGMGSKWINLWGLLPLIVESPDPSWPIAPGSADAVLRMLPIDLTRDTTRAVPTEDLAIHDLVSPIVRYAWTHDAGVPKRFDAAFSARVGDGLLVVSCFDHSTAAGKWMLSRLVNHAAAATSRPQRNLDLARFLAD